MATASQSLPKLPYPDFPLRPHRNGQWYKSVWNSCLKKSEQFYFGSWQDDPNGERALKDPEIGWLARKDAIRAGIDNVRVQHVSGVVALGELMARFLSHKHAQAKSGDLANATLEGYLREVQRFVTFMKPATPAAGLVPEHFTAYMRHMVDDRKLGRFARKRVRIKCANPIGRTFGRMVRELGLEGLSFYRLRHTFKTLGKKARDPEALDLAMGHKDASIGRVYDHSAVDWRRMKRLARMVRRQLWPNVKSKEGTQPQNPSRVADVGGKRRVRAA